MLGFLEGTATRSDYHYRLLKHKKKERTKKGIKHRIEWLNSEVVERRKEKILHEGNSVHNIKQPILAGSTYIHTRSGGARRKSGREKTHSEPFVLDGMKGREKIQNGGI